MGALNIWLPFCNHCFEHTQSINRVCYILANTWLHILPLLIWFCNENALVVKRIPCVYQHNKLQQIYSHLKHGQQTDKQVFVLYLLIDVKVFIQKKIRYRQHVKKITKFYLKIQLFYCIFFCLCFWHLYVLSLYTV